MVNSLKNMYTLPNKGFTLTIYSNVLLKTIMMSKYWYIICISIEKKILFLLYSLIISFNPKQIAKVANQNILDQLHPREALNQNYTIDKLLAALSPPKNIAKFGKMSNLNSFLV